MITVLLHVPIAVPPLEVISAWIEMKYSKNADVNATVRDRTNNRQ